MTARRHAFVAMPFGTKLGADGMLIDFNKVYRDYLQPALEAAGLEVFRADQEQRAGDIRTDMFQELLVADLVVADLTLDNPNVWYELGVRHALRARGVVLVCGGHVTTAFDLYTDRKLRYTLKDGAPDSLTLAGDVKKLTDMVMATMDSWHGRKISPVYGLMPNLTEPGWKSLRIGDVQEFWDKHDAWEQRIKLAGKAGHVGDMVVLADEAPVAAFRAEAAITAGVALRKAESVALALEQLERGLEAEPTNLKALQEKGICLQRLALAGAHRAIGRHTTGHDNRGRFGEHHERMRGAIREHGGHRRLEPCRDVLAPRIAARNALGDRGLEPAPGEITPHAAEQRAGQGDRRRIAARCHPFQMRPPRPRQAEHLRRLVEGLAHRIVERGAKPAVAAHPLYRHALAMPAREQQQQIGEGRRGLIQHARDARGQRVPLQVIDREKRNAARDGHALGEAAADDQPADQPGTRRPGHRGEVTIAQPRFLQHPRGKARQGGQMRARRDLGHHAAEAGVLRLLAENRLGQDAAMAVEDGGRGLVAARLQTQHSDNTGTFTHAAQLL